MREARHIICSTGWMSLLALAFCMFSCSENNPKPLDNAYLESKQYTDFRERSKSEIDQTKKANDIALQIKQYADCKAKLLPLPVELDSQLVAQLLNSNPDDCMIENNGPKLQLLGETVAFAQKIRWFLRERETAYRKQELLAVTFKDNNLKDYKTVGIFQKNLSQHIFSEILVRNEGNGIYITSSTVKNIRYPIEQSNKITTEYVIDREGNIRHIK